MSKLRKKSLPIALFLIFLVGLATFLNVAYTDIPVIFSKGKILYSNVNFIIRFVWVGAMKTASDVDKYVAEHPWGTGILLTDSSDGILSIISYKGYDSSKLWRELKPSPTYAEVKEVIDRFHYHGWKVVYSAGNTITKNIDLWSWNYFTREHPELIFMDGNGRRAGVEETELGILIPNFFANFSTPDPQRGILAGSRLIDMYTRRLKQMILDHSFEWDGWFGVDGWNGFTQSFGGEPHFWLWSTNETWGRWIGTSSTDYWFDSSYQSINEWWNASSYYHPIGFPPTNWGSMNNTVRAQWIRGNANLKWWEYWMDRFAKMYAQIREVFVETRPPEWYVGTIISQDTSSTWADNGINNPAGMENLTALAQYHSFDHYYIDCEWWGDLGLVARRQAYVAGLVKSKIPEAHGIVGLPIQYWDGRVEAPMPTWNWKQQYIAQIQTYVWKNGSRYRAVDPKWVLVWAPTTTTWNDTDYHGQEMADWVNQVANIMDRIEPIWLGPVDILPVYHRGNGQGYTSVNFTFAQFTDVMNIRNHPERILSAWGTIFLDAIKDYGRSAKGTYQRVLDLFASGNLNVLYHGYGYDAQFANTIFDGEGDVKSMNIFRMDDHGIGSSTVVAVLTQQSVSDPYGRWILSGYYGNTYEVDETGALGSSSGFTPLIKYSDDFIQLGLFYNSTSGRFFYGRSWSQATWSPTVRIPREIINRGIYWVSKSPLNSSESLVDYKVFRLNDGSLVIPMMNLKNFGSNLPFILSVDALALGLGSPTNYRVYWQSDNEVVNLSSWKELAVTLKQGADVLLIVPVYG